MLRAVGFRAGGRRITNADVLGMMVEHFKLKFKVERRAGTKPEPLYSKACPSHFAMNPCRLA